jgi:hypothetical protein
LADAQDGEQHGRRGEPNAVSGQESNATVEVPSANSAVSTVPRPHRRWISMNTTVPIGRR